MSSAESTPNSRSRAAGSSSSSSSGSSIQGKTRPCPRHVGHHPRGELNEKFFGSSSGNDSPVSISVRVVENHDSTSPDGSTRKQEPLPSARARSSSADGLLGTRGVGDEALAPLPGAVVDLLVRADATGSRRSFAPGFFKSPTTTSMSCSL